jgi:hypothetical protein
MYCPECGSDAENANFCPECGTDLTRLRQGSGRPEPGICPECGTDAGTARFCPECGHAMAGGSASRTTGQAKRAAAATTGGGATGRARQQRRQAERQAAQRSQKTTRPAPSSGSRNRSVFLIWGGFALAAVVVVIVVVAMSGGGGGGSAAANGGSSSTVGAVAADTSGSYTVLVTRANGLYDQGQAAFDKKNPTDGQKHFDAAAKVYAAAWKKQPGDPGVGTDYATALFYSGQTDKALKQVDVVLAANPDFQTAYLNKGIFLKTQSQTVSDAGDSAAAAKLLTQAKAAFTKAVSLGAGNDSGKRAAAELQNL